MDRPKDELSNSGLEGTEVQSVKQMNIHTYNTTNHVTGHTCYARSQEKQWKPSQIQAILVSQQSRRNLLINKCQGTHVYNTILYLVIYVGMHVYICVNM